MATLFQVGKNILPDVEPRNFYEKTFRANTLLLIVRFFREHGIKSPEFNWQDIGDNADDIIDLGVIVKINNTYEIHYMQLGEYFKLLYRDTVNPNEITDIIEYDSLEPTLRELFKAVLEDKASEDAKAFIDKLNKENEFEFTVYADQVVKTKSRA